MNIAQAKKIDLPIFLSRLGYKPVNEKKGQLWYLSPLRHETEPSFKVNPELNAWYDFAEGNGGDIIDFVKQHQRVTTVSDALACIAQVEGNQPLPKQETLPLQKPRPGPATKLQSLGPVKAKSLLNYLKSRGISIPLAASRVREAHYTCDGKPYFGLAFANDADGYELRNPMWKGTIGSKEITTIPGNDNSRVAVFEGFFDYLTAVMMHGDDLEKTVIVLNSVSFRDRAIDKLKEWDTQRVELFRDNDSAGSALLDYFREQLPNVNISDQAEQYSGHGDLNAWFVAQRQHAVT